MIDNKLITLITLAETKNFTRAANELMDDATCCKPPYPTT